MAKVAANAGFGAGLTRRERDVVMRTSLLGSTAIVGVRKRRPAASMMRKAMIGAASAGALLMTQSAAAHTDAIGFLISPDANGTTSTAQIYFGTYNHGTPTAEGSAQLTLNNQVVATQAFQLVPNYVGVANGVTPPGLVLGSNYFFVNCGTCGLGTTPFSSGTSQFQYATFTNLAAGTYAFGYASTSGLTTQWTPESPAINSGTFTITPSGNLGGVGGVTITPDIDTAVTSYTTTQLASNAVTSRFAGGTLTVAATGAVANGFTIASPGGTINTNANTLTATGTIADSGTNAGALSVTGGGKLILAGNNTYSGGTIVNGGALQLNTTTAAGTGAIHLVDPTLVLNAAGTYANEIRLEVAAPASGDPTVIQNTSGGAVNITGQVHETGAGGPNQYVTFDGGSTQLSNTANSWSGVTQINANTALTGTNQTISGASIIDNGALAYNQDADATVGQAITGTGSVTKSGTGNVTLTGANGWTGATTISGGALTGTVASLGGAGTITDNAALVYNQAADATEDSAITGTGSVTKQGAGTLTMASGGNGYTGGTTIQAGRLVEINQQAAAGNTAITTGAALELNQTSGVTYENGVLFTGGGTLVKTGAGTVAFRGEVRLDAGATIDVQAGILNTTSDGQGIFTNNLASVNVSAGAQFNIVEHNAQIDALTSNNTGGGTGTAIVGGGFGGGTSTLTLGAANGSGSFSGTLQDNTGTSGVLALTKTGTGTQTLAGTNTYSGATTISAGTLALTGSSSIANSAVTDNATLDISGVNGSTRIGSLAGTGLVNLGANTLIAGGNNASTTFDGVIGGTVNSEVYVGRWLVSDGVRYSTNPMVYTGQQAAALLFGGNASSYAISTLGTDPTQINHKTYLDGWGDSQYLFTPASDTYSLDTGAPGYNAPGGIGTSYSAYVNDHAGNAAGKYNYAFRATPVAASGGFTKEGSGTLILTNAGNLYTGVTTINDGILQGTTATISGSSVVDNATLALVQSATGTFAKDVSGNGNITLSGLGNGNTLTFSGALTNSGGLAILDASNVTLNGSYNAAPSGTALVSLGGGTFTNNGSITASVNDAVDAAISQDSILVNTGTITGGASGVISLYAGNTGSLTVSNSGTIQGVAFDGVTQHGSGTLTVANLGAGVIYGQNTSGSGNGYGVGSDGGGALTLDNGGAGVIVGNYGVVGSNAADQITNAGMIAAGSYAGGVVTTGGLDAVQLRGGGTVMNHVGGQIVGNGYGVRGNGSADTVINQENASIVGGYTGVETNGQANISNSGLIGSGTLSGGVYTNSGQDGIRVMAGGTVTNNAGGQIFGGAGAGIYLQNAAGTVVNSGTIQGDEGIYSFGFIGETITVTNNAGATINGLNEFGVFNGGGALVLTNAGTISGVTDGARSGGAMTLSNSGSITATGNDAVQGRGANSTILNTGSISSNLESAVTGGAGMVLTNANGATLTGGADGTYGFGVQFASNSGRFDNYGSSTGTGGGVTVNQNIGSGSGVTVNLFAGSTTGAIKLLGGSTNTVNLYTGTTTATADTVIDPVSGQAVTVRAAGTYGAAATGAIDLGAGGTNALNLRGAGTGAAGGSLAISALSNAGTLNKLDTGTWTLNGTGAGAGDLTTINAGNGTPSGLLVFNGTSGLTGTINVNGATIRAVTAGAFGTGTINAIDPTMQYGATGTYANNIVLNSGNTTNDPTQIQADNGVTATLTGSITEQNGPQPLVFGVTGNSGTSTVVLTNTANSWTGVTTINAGATLQGATNTISGASVTDNGVLAFVQPGSGTFTQNVSGTGNITVSGLNAGQAVTLSGALTNASGVDVLDASGLVITGSVAASNDYGINVNAGGTVTNLGSITTSYFAPRGVNFANGGTLTNGSANNTTASINAPTSSNGNGGYGVWNQAGALSVTNYATITGTGYGIENLSGTLTVDNRAGATISGTSIGINSSANNTTITNAGIIRGTGPATSLISNAIQANANGFMLTNLAGGQILAGANNALNLGGSGTATIINAGTIAGAAADTSSTFGQRAGIAVNGGSLNLTNSGTVNTTGTGAGVYVAANATINNQTGGQITGGTGAAGNAITVAGTLGLTNAATITAGSGTTVAVQIGGGGSLTQTSAGTINGSVVSTAGAFALNNAGMITGGTLGLSSGGAISGINSGVIRSTSTTAGDALTVSGGGSLTNTGTLSGYQALVSSGAAFSLTNSGLVSGANTAIVASNTGTFTLNNQNGGNIRSTGNGNGVNSSAANNAITNAGTITGQGNAINITATTGSSTITNTGTLSSILGGTNNSAVASQNTTVFTNSGTVSTPTVANNYTAAVYLNGANSSATNNVGGSITGGRGIELDSGGTIANYASVTGTVDNALSLFGGGTVTNYAGGTLTANGTTGAWGIFAGQIISSGAISTSTLTNNGTINAGAGIVAGHSNATITNSGSITAQDAGVWGYNGGTFSLANSGTINAAVTGVRATSAGSTISNSGLIAATAAGGQGVSATGGTSSITNLSGGTISGNGNGAAIYLAGAGNTVALNAGSTTTGLVDGSTTTGSNSYTVGGTLNGGLTAGGGTDTVTLLTGSTVSGTVDGGAGTDNFVLDGTGLGTFNAGTAINFENRVKNGTGTFTLTGDDGSTAPWTINAGTLALNGSGINGAINDAASVTVNANGTLALLASERIASLNGAGAVSLGANTLFLGTNNASSTFSGVASGTGGITQSGTGTLTLSGANTYTGTTYVSGGTFAFGASNVLADASTLFVQNGTVNLGANNDTIDHFALFGGTLNGTGTLTSTGASGFVGYTLANATINANLGTGSLGTGSGNTNTVLNGTVAASLVESTFGTLTLGASDRLADTATAYVDRGAILDLQAFNDTVSSLQLQGTLNGTGTLTAGNYFLTAGTVNANLGAGSVFVSRDPFTGDSVSTLNGTSGAGSVQVNQNATLMLGASNRLADNAAVAVNTGGTLNLGAFNDTVGTLTLYGNLNGTGTLTAASYTLASGTVNANLGAGILNHVAGTSTLNGTASAATVNIGGGTLVLGASNRLADNAAVGVSSGAALNLGAFSDTVGTLALAGSLNGTGTLTAASYTLFGGTVNANLGAGILNQASGTSTLNGASGAATVNIGGGTLVLGASNRLADNAAVGVSSGATLNLGANSDTVGLLALAGTLNGSGTLTATEYDLMGATVNANLGAGNLFQLSGTSVLNGTAGATNVSVQGGTLALGASNRLADAATVAVANGATLDLGAFSDTVGLAQLSGTLNGTGTLTANQYQLNGATVNANLGSGTLFQLGGTSVLNGTAGSANVMVNTGTLTLGASNRLADNATVAVANGAVLNLGANSDTVGLLALSGTLNGSGTLTASEYDLMGATVNANLGAGNLFQLAGTSVLNGTAASANVMVNAGTLALGASERLADTATVVVAKGATLNLGALASSPQAVAAVPSMGATVVAKTAADRSGPVAAGGMLDGFSSDRGQAVFGTSSAAVASVEPENAQPTSYANDFAVAATNPVNETVGLLVLNGTLAGNGTLTASQYQLNGATVNANLGTGTLFQLGGTSVLNGTAAAGTVAINAGTLRLGAAERLADVATVNVASGATFDLANYNETIGTLTGAGTVALGTATLAVGGTNADFGFGGTVNGSGDLTKTGTGTFTLVGNQSMTGRLNVNAGGVLFAGTSAGAARVQGGVLSGSGTFAGNLLLASGTLSPGMAGQPIAAIQAGSFTATGGSYAVDFSGSTGGFSSDFLRVTGAAALSGGNVVPTATEASANYKVSQSYLILQSNALTGTFANGATFAQVSGSSDLYWRLRYDLAPNGVALEVRKVIDFTGGLAAAGASGNQVAVGGALNGGILTGSDAWMSALNTISALSVGQRQATYDSLGGESIADITTSVARAGNRFTELLRDRLAMGGGMNSGDIGAVAAVIDGRASGDALRQAAPTLGGASQIAGDGARVNAWLQGYGANGTVRGQGGSASIGTFDAGAAGGIDLRSGAVLVGVAGSVADVETTVRDRFSRNHGTLYQGGGYVAYDDGATYGNAVASYFGGDVDTARSVFVGGSLFGRATGRTGTHGYAFGAALGHRIALNDGLYVTPQIAGQALQVTRNAFTETGAGVFSLAVAREKRDLYSAIGELKVSHKGVTASGGVVEPYASVGVRVNFGDLDTLSAMRFTGAPTGTGAFSITGARLAPVAGVLTGGIDAHPNDHVTLGAEVTSTIAKRDKDSRVGLHIKIGF